MPLPASITYLYQSWCQDHHRMFVLDSATSALVSGVENVGTGGVGLVLTSTFHPSWYPCISELLKKISLWILLRKAVISIGLLECSDGIRNQVYYHRKHVSGIFFLVSRRKKVRLRGWEATSRQQLVSEWLLRNVAKLSELQRSSNPLLLKPFSSAAGHIFWCCSRCCSRVRGSDVVNWSFERERDNDYCSWVITSSCCSTMLVRALIIIIIIFAKYVEVMTNSHRK